MANWTEIKPGVWQSETGSIITEVPDLGACLVVILDDLELLIPLEDLVSNPLRTFVSADTTTGKLDVSLLPAIAINDVYPVSSESEQLALICETGDFAFRTDQENQFYILAGTDPSIPGHWIPISVQIVDTTARADIATLTDSTNSRLTALETDTAQLASDLSNETDQRSQGDSTLQSQIDAIDSTIGTATLTTTDQTVTEAINEIKDLFENSEIGQLASDLDALESVVGDTTLTTTAQTTTEAINEVLIELLGHDHDVRYLKNNNANPANIRYGVQNPTGASILGDANWTRVSDGDYFCSRSDLGIPPTIPVAIFSQAYMIWDARMTTSEYNDAELWTYIKEADGTPIDSWFGWIAIW